MLKYKKWYSEASFQTKLFYLMVALYGLALVAGTVYPYARLDYDRSYAVKPQSQ